MLIILIIIKHIIKHNSIIIYFIRWSSYNQTHRFSLTGHVLLISMNRTVISEDIKLLEVSICDISYVLQVMIINLQIQEKNK